MGKLKGALALLGHFKSQQKLLRFLHECPDPETLLDALGRGETSIYAAGLSLDTVWCQEEQAEAEKRGIRLLLNGAPGYPEVWARCTTAPAIVYQMGELPEGPLVAIVGAREAAPETLRYAEQLAEEFSRTGVGVVSGLARGVDCAAHRGCLKGKAPTVAVLGSGLLYPLGREREQLKRRIVAEGGAVLSEQPLQAWPQAQALMQRNRLITGLADKVIVMEAGSPSGSLQAGLVALKQGKEVLVPSRGVGKRAGLEVLLARGAKPL